MNKKDRTQEVMVEVIDKKARKFRFMFHGCA